MKLKPDWLLLAILWLIVPVRAQEQTGAVCDTAEAKAFDFLVGEWRAADNAAATMRIEKVLRGCAVREVWQEGRGEAWLLRSFDAVRQKWFLLFLMNDRLSYQSWEGRWEANQWRFYREWMLEGQSILSRTYWNPLPSGGFEKLVDQSRDGGRTWKMHAKSVYQRKQ